MIEWRQIRVFVAALIHSRDIGSQIAFRVDSLAIFKLAKNCKMKIQVAANMLEMSYWKRLADGIFAFGARVIKFEYNFLKNQKSNYENVRIGFWFLEVWPNCWVQGSGKEFLAACWFNIQVRFTVILSYLSDDF